MKKAIKMPSTSKAIRRTLAFVLALAIVGTSVIMPKDALAAPATEKVTYADNYRSMFPSLSAAKMKLEDPALDDKMWYEYVEYEQFTEVVQGDYTYRIFRPTDYAKSSVMALCDYKESNFPTASTSSLQLGELQDIFSLAAKGSSISSAFGGKDYSNTIASKMDSINDFVNNSKYYSNLESLGIPNDEKFNKGVSNSGFFNASSVQITFSESNAVNIERTFSANSEYCIKDGVSTAKNYSAYLDQTVGSHNSWSKQITTGKESSREAGWSLDRSSSSSEYNKHTSGNTIVDTTTEEDNWKLGGDVGFGIGNKISPSINGKVKLSDDVEIGAGLGTEYSRDLDLGINGSIGSSSAVTNQITIDAHNERYSQNIDSSKFNEYENSSDNSSISKSIAQGGGLSNSITTGQTAGGEVSATHDASTAIGYGTDFSASQQTNFTHSVTRTFEKRTEEEVRDVGWKLCEYVVKVPYYIEVVKTYEDGDNKQKQSTLYSQYVTYNLLSGVCRVFANGYIEHWFTGDLVVYADFFEGFLTVPELVEKAKEQQKLN